jgi:Arc/MetJ-type ribon-helix-helix transcriptional regulator
MQCVILRKVNIPNEGTVMKTFVETSSILLEGVDEMIREGYFHDRSEAVNEALTEMLDRYKLSKLRAKERKIGQNKKTKGVN